MVPNQHTRKPDEVRRKDELLPLATDFIDQYYTSIKRQEKNLFQDILSENKYLKYIYIFFRDFLDIFQVKKY